MGSYDEAIKELRIIQDQIRTIRERTCDPKSNENARYLGLSNAVSGINKAIDNMLAEQNCKFYLRFPRTSDSSEALVVRFGFVDLQPD